MNDKQFAVYIREMAKSQLIMDVSYQAKRALRLYGEPLHGQLSDVRCLQHDGVTVVERKSGTDGLFKIMIEGYFLWPVTLIRERWINGRPYEKLASNIQLEPGLLEVSRRLRRLTVLEDLANV